MHDIKAIRDNPQAFDAGLKRRGLSPLSEHLIWRLMSVARAIVRVLRHALARRKAASKENEDARRRPKMMPQLKD